MPAGNDTQQRSQTVSGVTVHEKIGRRKESGSQFSLVVTQLNLPPLQNLELSELIDSMQMRISNRRSVQRGGLTGIAGTITAGVGGVEGAEAEIFLHQNKLIVVAYAPYSKIKDRVGGTMKPRANERELDRPDEFFASLQVN